MKWTGSVCSWEAKVGSGGAHGQSICEPTPRTTDRPYSDDPFHEAALETHDILEAAGLEIDVIPEPAFRRVRSDDFVASYANYYVCNGAVIAAQFGDPDTDEIAYESLRRHLPGREIIMLDVDPLGEIGGGIHCATQQMPDP